MSSLPLILRASSSHLPSLCAASRTSRKAAALLEQWPLTPYDPSDSHHRTQRHSRPGIYHSGRPRRQFSSSATRRQHGRVTPGPGSASTTPPPVYFDSAGEEHHDQLADRPCGSPASSLRAHPLPKLPFRFDTGVGLFAKRTPRPFPPPFHSPPSASFSDALSTHDRSRDRRAFVDGQLIGGCTNGDDAVYASELFIAANDGVGAWSMRPRGHAGLWARLIVHFWAEAVRDALAKGGAEEAATPQPVRYLQRAYEQTIEATRSPNDWQGTTTATGALLTYRRAEGEGKRENAGEAAAEGQREPLLYVTNLGDSQVMVVRPAEGGRIVYKTKEQWHWFDCPRQLGTNSPDTPRDNAAVDAVPVRVGDVVLAMSDGVIDNLWSHEIAELVSRSVAAWQAKEKTPADLRRGMMTYVAEELVEAARVIAVDPFAQSPFMEHAIEEGLPSEGGKLDDISVVAAVVRRNDTA